MPDVFTKDGKIKKWEEGGSKSPPKPLRTIVGHTFEGKQRGVLGQLRPHSMARLGLSPRDSQAKNCWFHLVCHLAGENSREWACQRPGNGKDKEGVWFHQRNLTRSGDLLGCWRRKVASAWWELFRPQQLQHLP